MRIYPASLIKTVDSVHEAFFFGERVPSREREEVALWIAGRQGLPGAYANMFAPTSADAKNGIRLFTGETIGPSAGLRHISGEEACRALVLLKPRSKEAQAALKCATDGMLSVLVRARQNKRDFFCCGTCDPSLWRHISAGGLQGAEEWLNRGMKALKAHRDGEGRWRRFPFYFTLLALSEIDLPAATQEMRYAASVCERCLARAKSTSPIANRRRIVLERVLVRC